MITAGLCRLTINGTVFPVDGYVDILIDQLQYEPIENSSGSTLLRQKGIEGGRIKGANIFIEGAVDKWNELLSQTDLSIQLVIHHRDGYREYSMTNAAHVGERIMNAEKNTVSIDFISPSKIEVAKTGKPV